MKDFMNSSSLGDKHFVLGFHIFRKPWEICFYGNLSPRRKLILRRKDYYSSQTLLSRLWRRGVVVITTA